MAEILSKEDWLQWAAHPCTKELHRQLTEAVDNVKEDWSRSAFIREDREASDRRNLAALMRVEVLRSVIDVVVEAGTPLPEETGVQSESEEG